MRVLILVLLLSGCALHEQMIADRIAGKAVQCEKIGYTPNTDAFRNCQLQLYRADEARSAAAMSVIQQQRPVTCQTIGAITNCY